MSDLSEPQSFALGLAAMRQADPDAAALHFKAALEADPAPDRNWLACAAALLAAGEARDAAKVLQQGRQRGLQGPDFDTLAAHFRAGDYAAAYAAAARLHQAGQLRDAVQAYGLVLAAHPGALEALANLGNARLALGRHAGAAAAYREALGVAPGDPELHTNLGYALSLQNQPDAAEAEYRRALEIAPGYAMAHHNLGMLLLQQDRSSEAVEYFRRAIALKPDHAGAYWGLGTALCAMGEIAESFKVFTEHGERFYAASVVSPAPPHKQRHDREQRIHLGLNKDAAPDTVLRLADGGRIAGPAIHSGHGAAVTQAWQERAPQIVTVDDFLTAEALEELRQFCWGSNVWQKVYDDGYLGAMPEYGFACPLLAQIAEELPRAYPEIFAGHPLRYLWGFKYDSSLRGINIHADKAAVNVNFWITPDEANRDPAHGGLVVWDKVAPMDWEPDRYNGDIAASRAFLTGMGAKPVTIPYRANRAVIFDSDLFHETDKIDFAPGYLNRRINITLLYGDRRPGEP